MSLSLTKFISALALAATATATLAASAIADPLPSSATKYGIETLPDSIFRAAYTNSGNFYYNTSTQRQLDLIIGPPRSIFQRGAFPEVEIERDAELIEIIYRDAMYQQTQSDPYLRTPDLPNPFGGSLFQQLSTGALNNRLTTSDYVLERPPTR